MGAPADVCAHQDLAVEVCLGELLEGQLQDLEVIGGGVGAGVAGTKQAGQCLAGLIEVAEQRVEAEAALVVAGGVLLLGVGAKQRGVDVEDQLAWAGRPPPRPPRRFLSFSR